jgi:hypothetical protein
VRGLRAALRPGSGRRGGGALRPPRPIPPTTCRCAR